MNCESLFVLFLKADLGKEGIDAETGATARHVISWPKIILGAHFLHLI